MEDKRKLKKRPCSICRRWFQPDPRVRHCQKTCSKVCQKKWAARRQARWREENPDYLEEVRLRRAVRLAEKDGAVLEMSPRGGPMAKVPWAVVQTALGAKNAVVLAFALRLLDQTGKTAIRVRIVEPSPSSGRLQSAGSQTAIEVLERRSESDPSWRCFTAPYGGPRLSHLIFRPISLMIMHETQT